MIRENIVENRTLELTKPENIKRNLLLYSALAICFNNYSEGINIPFIGKIPPENTQFLLSVLIFYYFTNFIIYCLNCYRAHKQNTPVELSLNNCRIIVMDYFVPLMFSVYALKWTDIDSFNESDKLSIVYTVFRGLGAIALTVCGLMMIKPYFRHHRLFKVLHFIIKFLLIGLFVGILFCYNQMNIFSLGEVHYKIAIIGLFICLLFANFWLEKISHSDKKH